MRSYRVARPVRSLRKTISEATLNNARCLAVNSSIVERKKLRDEQEAKREHSSLRHIVGEMFCSSRKGRKVGRKTEGKPRWYVAFGKETARVLILIRSVLWEEGDLWRSACLEPVLEYAYLRARARATSLFLRRLIIKSSLRFLSSVAADVDDVSCKAFPSASELSVLMRLHEQNNFV